LQPHEGLANRYAAAQALQTVPCLEDCIGAILHYLERIWAGEFNGEDELPVSENARVALRRKQNQVYDALYAVLKRQPSETIGILIKVYGLDTVDPSKFALDLVARIHLQEACPALLNSMKDYKRTPDIFVNAPHQAVQSAIDSLHCQ